MTESIMLFVRSILGAYILVFGIVVLIFLLYKVVLNLVKLLVKTTRLLIQRVRNLELVEVCVIVTCTIAVLLSSILTWIWTLVGDQVMAVILVGVAVVAFVALVAYSENQPPPPPDEQPRDCESGVM